MCRVPLGLARRGQVESRITRETRGQKPAKSWVVSKFQIGLSFVICCVSKEKMAANPGLTYVTTHDTAPLSGAFFSAWPLSSSSQIMGNTRVSSSPAFLKMALKSSSEYGPAPWSCATRRIACMPAFVCIARRSGRRFLRLSIKLSMACHTATTHPRNHVMPIQCLSNMGWIIGLGPPSHVFAKIKNHTNRYAYRCLSI